MGACILFTVRTFVLSLMEDTHNFLMWSFNVVLQADNCRACLKSVYWRIGGNYRQIANDTYKQTASAS